MTDNNEDPIKEYGATNYMFSNSDSFDEYDENYNVSDDVYNEVSKSTNGASLFIFMLLIIAGILIIMMTMLFSEFLAYDSDDISKNKKSRSSITESSKTEEMILADRQKQENKYKDYPFERIEYIDVGNGEKLYTIYGAIGYEAHADSMYDLDSSKYKVLTNIIEVKYYEDISLEVRYDFVEWLLENGYRYAGAYNSETIYVKGIENAYMFVSITPNVLTYGVSDGNSSELFN